MPRDFLSPDGEPVTPLVRLGCPCGVNVGFITRNTITGKLRVRTKHRERVVRGQPSRLSFGVTFTPELEAGKPLHTITASWAEYVLSDPRGTTSSEDLVGYDFGRRCHACPRWIGLRAEATATALNDFDRRGTIRFMLLSEIHV